MQVFAACILQSCIHNDTWGRALFQYQLTFNIVTYLDLLSLAMGRLTTWRLTPPDLILLNTEMASLWLRPVNVYPFTERISSPSLSLPSSAAYLYPSTVLTKIPMLPFAESRQSRSSGTSCPAPSQS